MLMHCILFCFKQKFGKYLLCANTHLVAQKEAKQKKKNIKNKMKQNNAPL